LEVVGAMVMVLVLVAARFGKFIAMAGMMRLEGMKVVVKGIAGMVVVVAGKVRLFRGVAH